MEGSGLQQAAVTLHGAERRMSCGLNVRLYRTIALESISSAGWRPWRVGGRQFGLGRPMGRARLRRELPADRFHDSAGVSVERRMLERHRFTDRGGDSRR